jgi:acyl-CoA synthetase (AMP-forming)/AMP-acid ligase II
LLPVLPGGLIPPRRRAIGHVTTIPQTLRHAAQKHSRSIAVADDDLRMTFPELAFSSQTVARALIGSGVEPGDRVALWAPNSALWVVVSMGVYMAGAVLVPVNTRYRSPEAEHILRKSGCRLVLTVSDFGDTDYPEALAGLAEPTWGQPVLMSGPPRQATLQWEEFLSAGADVAVSRVLTRESGLQDDSPSDIIFTSGTTGAPKGAVLTHGASVTTYEAWSDLVGLRPADRHLVIYPFFHTAGLKSGVLASVIKGATLYPHAVFDVPAVMAKIATERITVFPGTPTVFQSILHHPDLASFDLSSLRLSVTGASVVPVAVVEAMHEKLGIETVVTGYGMTETTGTISMCRHDDPLDVIARTVGRPIPGVEVRVVGDDGADVESGHPGELWVRGFNVMHEYFDDPAATAEAITPDGWLKTGDIGLLDEPGNIRITDRKKDMFIVGGFNAYPAEIEACLLGHPGIAQVAVVGTPDERMGEVGAAFVVPVAGVDIDPDEVVAWARQRLANFKVPRRVIVRSELPTTPSGKVMKFELRDSLL